MAPSRRRHRAARARAQRLHVRHLPPSGDHPGRPGPRRPHHPERRLPARDDVRGTGARRLLAHHRHRHRAHVRERVLRARGQHAHALRRLLHAGEPRDHDAHVPRAVRAQPRGGGGGLSRQPAPDARKRGADQSRSRADGGSAHPRHPQQRLLRALVSRRPDGRGAGGGAGSRRGQRRLADEDHARHEAGRCHLSAHRRFISRPAHVPARFRSRRARHLRRLSRRPPHHRQRARAPASPTTSRSTPTCPTSWSSTRAAHRS